MSRKKEIAGDLWAIMRTVYSINEVAPQSEKQTKLINDIVEYLDANLSLRKKKQDTKEK